MRTKRLPGFSRYLFFSDGTVYSEVSSRFLVCAVNTGRKKTPGYKTVTLMCDNNCGKHHKHVFLVHRVLAEIFFTRVPGKDRVNHIDGNKLNNVISNLEWVSGKENMAHAIRSGLIPTGSKSKLSKLTQEQRDQIKIRLADLVKATEALGYKRVVGFKKIAKEFGVSPALISYIFRRQGRDEAKDTSGKELSSIGTKET